jgi:hypothetical protein
MIGIDALLDMVCTEVLEADQSGGERKLSAAEAALPPIRYELELIQGPDGKPYWVE